MFVAQAVVLGAHRLNLSVFSMCACVFAEKAMSDGHFARALGDLSLDSLGILVGAEAILWSLSSIEGRNEAPRFAVFARFAHFASFPSDFRTPYGFDVNAIGTFCLSRRCYVAGIGVSRPEWKPCANNFPTQSVAVITFNTSELKRSCPPRRTASGSDDGHRRREPGARRVRSVAKSVMSRNQAVCDV